MDDCGPVFFNNCFVAIRARLVGRRRCFYVILGALAWHLLLWWVVILAVLRGSERCMQNINSPRCGAVFACLFKTAVLGKDVGPWRENVVENQLPERPIINDIPVSFSAPVPGKRCGLKNAVGDSMFAPFSTPTWPKNGPTDHGKNLVDKVFSSCCSSSSRLVSPSGPSRGGWKN